MKSRKTRQRKAPAKRAAKGRTASLKASANTGRGWPAGMETMYRPIKKPVTLRLDADVIAWFKTQGRGYQTRINRALREVMVRGRKRG
jgi:uncharacterized protein (DUF4415 family)